MSELKPGQKVLYSYIISREGVIDEVNEDGTANITVTIDASGNQKRFENVSLGDPEEPDTFLVEAFRKCVTR